ncbi:deoxyhypusine synthase [Novymonas esmeraldas]|uniref:Deoxyhypusine synthase n=1 Tax=Novymonas esmeraldas TaxID=1808958 RepID=A0AAW0ETB2_9TRYP
MANAAVSAVLVSSAASAEAVAKLAHVQGPGSHFHDAQHVLQSYQTMGFQATHYGHARSIAQRMIRQQQPSKVYQMKDGAYVLVPREVGEDGRQVRLDPVYPTLFMGVAANLMGTGCREAVRFLVQEGIDRRPLATPEDGSEDQLMFSRLREEYVAAHGHPPHPDEDAPLVHSFLSALVVSGGGIEHDLRRACTEYTVQHYASEAPASAPPPAPGGAAQVTFGNVAYPRQGSPDAQLFDGLMHIFADRLSARQARQHAAAAAKPIPDKYEDVCSWSVAPSEVWALCGLWLVDMLAEALAALPPTADATAEGSGSNAASTDAAAGHRAEALARARTTVVYWASVQQVPLYSPSFVDGDIVRYVLPPSAGARGRLLVDLVRDVHSINKLAMLSKKTGMLICGGGVVKHHVCNANLMRNGADLTIILNNGQEFDGSDAGAKPEEALSWGKVRMEGEFVKVYGEVSTYLPLLVAEVFVPAVRQRRINDALPPRKKRASRSAKKPKKSVSATLPDEGEVA